MAEREELKIQVTLVDNATAGLRAMRQSLDELGGGKSAQNLQNFRRRTQEAHDKGLKPFTEDLEDATKKMFPFVREIGGIATGMIAVGYAADKAVEALADFAKEQANIGKLSEQTGFDPAAVKMMHETFARAGVGAKESSKDIAGFAHAMADVTRVNSEIRRKLFEGQKTGAEIEGMQSFFGDLVKFADDPTKFGNRVIEGYEQIKQNLLKRGETPERAAEGAQKFINQVFGVPDVTQLVQFHEKFKEVTKEDIERQNNRKQAAEEYLRTTNSIAESWDKINAAWWDQAITSSPLMTSMHWIDDMMKQWAETAEKQEKAAKEHPATFTEKINPFSEKGADYWRAQKKAAGQEDDISTAPLKKWWNDTFGSEPAPGGIQPLLSPGWGAGSAGGEVRGGLAPESWPFSSNIEDRRGEAPFQPGQDEEVKTQRDLMEQTKRLAEDFERLFAQYGGAAGIAGLAAPGSLAAQAGLNDIGGRAGGGGGGAGSPLGILGGGLGGGGLGGVPGMGGLPGLGGGGGGGGGGPPHGSDVGPGTGPGAGDTPAGAGAAGVNAGGGGAGKSFVDQVKKFEGFAPRAQWDYKQFTSGYGTKAGYAGEPITREEAEKRLQSELGKAGQAVDAINPNLDSGTRSALTDLVFNAGPGALKGIKGAIASGDTAAIKQWLPAHYRTAGGKELSALVQRRAAEASWVGNKDFDKDGGAPPTGSATAATTGTAAPSGGGQTEGDVARIMKDVDPRLVAVAQAGATYLPEGYTLRPVSGRSGREGQAYGFHPSGRASDWQIYGPDNKPISNRGDDSSGLYTTWARGAYTEALKNDPELAAKLGWGGAFATVPGGKTPDLMHLDEGGMRGALRPGNILSNLGPFKRSEIDNQMAQRVEGTGKLSVNVNAPKGTQVAAEGGGIFKKTEVTRQTQMEPAASSMASQYQE